ncbi:MAG: NAD-dependent epimerase/dehydratase family protein [Cyclobacteriaceae bacterium]|jgi:uncharacterized protein YbjT (DUF2867 family)|nr:NAD-dependent epimerase/dehydratase family protein [Cyclobacteriaceae bacterium]
MARTALVAGSTGLIGSQLVDLLLADGYYNKVIALSRKSLPVSHTRLQNVLVDIHSLDKLSTLKADDVFCCLGTTMKQAGSKEAFKRVDYEYPLQLAKSLKSTGAKKFLLVSALGADKSSRIFYNKVKGIVEEGIGNLAYDSYHIFRPSLLIGPRKEARAGEDAAKIFYSFFGFLIPKKYKGIESAKVARAMMTEAKSDKVGLQIYESVALQEY